MINKSILLFFSLIIHFPTNAEDKRVLLKLPYDNREDLLKGMRNTNFLMEQIIRALGQNDFNKVERIASVFLLDTKKSGKLPYRYDANFIALAVDFHTTGTVEIIRAARKKDMSQTLQSLANFYSRCNSCHEAYRVVEWPDKKYPEPKAVPLNIPKFYNYNDWVTK